MICKEYGEIKKEWLSSFLELPNGIPSHDTFNRFFPALDADVFEACFLSWVKSIVVTVDEHLTSQLQTKGRGLKYLCYLMLIQVLLECKK